MKRNYYKSGSCKESIENQYLIQQFPAGINVLQKFYGLNPNPYSLRKVLQKSFGLALLLLWFHNCALGQVLSTFSSGSASWVCPAGVTSITVRAWGAGGGGGSSAATATNGGTGGGGGAFSQSVLTVVPGTTYYYSVGAAGAATSTAALAGIGGSSWFNTTNTVPTSIAGVLAVGGGRGVNNSTAAPNNGGAAALGFGQITWSGGSGFQGTANRGGGGGASAGFSANGTAATDVNGRSAFDMGGNGGNSTTTPTTGPSQSGFSPGGGGGGSDDVNNFLSGAGGAGRVVIIKSNPIIADDFSSDNSFAFVNGTQTNRWTYGTASGNPGSSIYISNNNGAGNIYAVGNASVVHAYREVVIPTGVTLAKLEFNWLCNGEVSWDYFRVWLVPNSFMPAAGTQITAGAGRIQVAGDFNNQNSWQQYTNASLDISTFANSTMRIVFEWRNDTSGGNDNPAAIDNVSFVLPPAAPQAVGNINFGPIASANGTALRGDANITAATCFSGCVGGGHESWRGRLFNVGPGYLAWASGDNVVGTNYLQFDLGSTQRVSGVSTQSRGSDCCDFQRVTSYTIEHSVNGSSWTPIAGTFPGNTVANTVVTNTFAFVNARYVRIIPQGFNSHMSMRADIITTPCNGSAVSMSAEIPTFATNVRWYDAPTGGTLLQTGQYYTIPALNANQTVYAESFNSTYNYGSLTRTPVNLTVYAPTSTNGSAQLVCNGTTVALSGNTPSPGSGVWSVFSGPNTTAGQFSNVNSPISNFTPIGGVGNYVVRWSVTNAGCTGVSDATIQWSSNPVLNPITGNTALCVGSTSTLGGNSFQYQAFTASGTFTPTVSGNAQVLVVAGGGAGGTGRGGGGGAGGVIFNQSVAVTAGTPVSVTVGAGGVGSTTFSSITNGGNSSFGAIIATGGGRGGSHDAGTSGTQVTNQSGAAGGSGGGAAINYSLTGSSSWSGGAASPSGQGFAGGSAGPANNDNPRSTGGGGGAGGAGVSGLITGSPSNGGIGVSNSISGSAVFYGGGGGGANGNASGEGFTTAGNGTGGNGGGGNGAPMGGNPTAGAANTGGGGGGGGAGGSSTSIGGNGGSGIVIVKFPNFSWSSSNTSVATVNPNTGVVTAVAVGSAIITYTVSAGGCSSSVTTTVTVNTADVITATSSVGTSLCLGSSTNLGVTQTGGNGTVYTLNWTMTAYPNSGLSGSTPATLGTPISVTPTAVGSYIYTINGTSTSCNTSSAVTVNVINPAASVSVLATATPNPACFGSTTVLSAITFNPIAAPAYTAPPAVLSPTADEDFGNITITQGATTILNNTSVINSLSGTIGTATGTAGSYSNFTAFGPYNLIAGQSYNFSVSSLTTGLTYQNAMAIYIDYNRNGVFTDAGENVFIQGATVLGAHTVTGSFNVPTGVALGLTRMRVVSNEGLVSSPTMTISYGEYEEYAINLGAVSTGLTWFNGASSIGTTNPLTTAAISATSTFTAQATFSGCPVTSNAVVVTPTPLPLPPTFTNNNSICVSGVPSVTFAGANGQPVATANLNWFNAATGGTNVNSSSVLLNHYVNNFSSNLTSGSVVGSVAGTAALNSGEVRITEALADGQIGGFTVPGTGFDADEHKISFSFKTAAATAVTDQADGMSVNFGDDIPASSGGAELGAGSKLSICFDTYELTGPTSEGIRIKYGGVQLAFSPNVAWRGATVPVVIDISSAGLVTVTVSGVALLSNIPLPPSFLSTNKAAWNFRFLARSGAVRGEHTIDNVDIKYLGLVSATTFPNSISSTTTWYVSETVGACTSTTTPVTVTVVPLPAFALSSTTQSICSGDNSTPVTITTGAADYDVYNWTPTSAVSGNASSGWIFSPTSGGTPSTAYYFLNVSQSAGPCVNSAPISITINPVPSAVTASSSLGTICDGATVDLTSSATSNFAQTILSPTGNGGFENGTTFTSNGWITANNTNNQWYVGTAAVNGGFRGAYISTNGSVGVLNNYNVTSANIGHIYRDVTIPAGVTNITLSFNWRGVGEVGQDYLRVSLVPTSTTPVAGTLLASGQLGSDLNNQSTWQSVSLPVSAALAGTTQRLVFTWINNNSLGTAPSGAIDNVAIIASDPTPASYAWTAVPVGFTSAVQNPTSVAPTANTTYTVEVTNGFNCKATNTTAVVVNPKPTAAITSASQQWCFGNTPPAILGTIAATGAYTLTLSNGSTATGTGSGSWSIPVSPTVPTTYTITNIVDANGCPLGVVSGNPTLTPPPTPTADLSPTASATCVVTGNNWTHFYTSAGKLVVSIKGTSVAADLGSVTADAYVDAAQTTTACVDPVNEEYWTAVMGRHWKISASNPGPAVIRLPVTSAEVAALVAQSAVTAINANDDVFSIANVNLSKYNGLNENGSWLDNCNSATNTSNATSELYITQAGNGAITVANGFVETIGGSSFIEFSIPGFSEFWLMNSIFATPLPVNLTSFAASCEENEVAVKWTTATEQNSQSFIIERSRDLAIWEFVSEVAAAGNSSSVLNYATVDANPLSGITYYRMKQIDLNGVQKIYGPISVSCGDIENSMIVFPNPTKGNFTVEISSNEDLSDAQLVISDLSGKIVSIRSLDILQGKTQALFENLDLQLGTYIIKLNSSNHNIPPVMVVVN